MPELFAFTYQHRVYEKQGEVYDTQMRTFSIYAISLMTWSEFTKMRTEEKSLSFLSYSNVTSRTAMSATM